MFRAKLPNLTDAPVTDTLRRYGAIPFLRRAGVSLTSSGHRLRAGVVLLAVTAAGCADSPTNITEPSIEAAAGRSKATLSVRSPIEGATLTGVQLFQARVDGASLDSYSMEWQVDGGSMTSMSNSLDGGYKEASVDVSTWTWRGPGPYTVTFVAKDARGRKMASKSVSIMVDSPPPPTSGTSTNPFAGVKLYVDPYSNAKQQADAWRSTRPADAAQIDKIANQPQAFWFGSWHSDIQAAVATHVGQITTAGALPVLIAYNIPIRDCNSYSSGGASSPDAYRTWIREFARGIGSAKAVVILEPDALAGMGCLSSTDQQIRLELIADAVTVLKGLGATSVYIDAGHSSWISVSTMATRLASAGIAAADGFSLNVSNFYTNSENIVYGEKVSAAVGGKHFVIDSSRNGLGSNGEWCNPAGRALGTGSTASTGHALVDAFYWMKRPGESDGTCNGGPKAGAWWADYALDMAMRTSSGLIASN